MRITVTPTINQRIRQGLVAYWPLNEAAGATSKSDLRGPAIADMEVVGTVGSDVGPSNNLRLARSFGGGASYLQTADSPIFSPQHDFTVAGWIYITSKASIRAMLSQSSGASDVAFMVGYHIAPDRFRFGVSPDGTESGNAAVVVDAPDTGGSPGLNTWYFLCARYSLADGRARMRVNSAPEGTSVGGVSVPFNSTASLRIGHYFNIGHVGRLSSIGYWNRLLSEGEIAWLYNGGQGRDLQRGV